MSPAGVPGGPGGGRVWHTGCNGRTASPLTEGVRMPKSPCSSDQEIGDEVLMERYVEGDAAAFDVLFRRYERRAFAFFARRTRSADRAEDLYQELFLRIHRARHTYDPRRPFAPWFFQIAHRLLIDDERRAFRNHEVPLDEASLNATNGGGLDTAADHQYLAQLLGGLSEGERYVLLAAKGEGASHAELAAQLGKSVDAVKKMASRALRRLQHAALVETQASAQIH